MLSDTLHRSVWTRRITVLQTGDGFKANLIRPTLSGTDTAKLGFHHSRVVPPCGHSNTTCIIQSLEYDMRTMIASITRLLAVFLLTVSYGALANNATVSTIATNITGLDGISIGPDGAFYVSQPSGNRVWRITDSSTEVFLDGLEFPLGSAWDTDGNFYVSSSLRVVRRTPDGQAATFATGFSLASGLAFAADGTLYVGDYNLDQVSTVTPGGIRTTFSIGGSLDGPAGVVIDSQGQVYAGNFDDGNIIRFGNDGGQTIIARPDAQTGYIAIDDNDLIYATGFASNLVFTVTLDGEVTPLAGSGSIGSNDGAASDATFLGVNGIAVTPDGSTVYISEFGQEGGLRSIAIPTFEINQGITGSWFFPETAGSGFFLDYDPTTEFLFATWLTYANEEEGADGTSRWLIGDALATGNSADLTLFRTAGGRFNGSNDVSVTPIGTMRIQFIDCSRANVSYELDSGLNGEFSMMRLLPGTENLCEAFSLPPAPEQ